MTEVMILLGTNINPDHWAKEGPRLLAERVEILSLGRGWRTKAEGEGPHFVNRAIRAKAPLNKWEWRSLLKGLESEAGRPSSHEPDAPRTLDLDLVWVEGVWEKHPGLRRPYAVLPLADVVGENLGPDGESLKVVASRLRHHPTILGLL
ncbi:2-amino-4-hydroxy-6-hydroxymethyldihydropteridine diphosphokinase [bacterium]|nr:2-amino-4-hydroxy-6-hydroxymethyldihydropteridine diphosphokinase [bacterium]